MPVPIPGSKVGSDNQKVKFLTIFGRPKTGIFRRFRGVPGGPKTLDMDTLAARKGVWVEIVNRFERRPVETGPRRDDGQ